MQNPLIIAHRGESFDAPENTLTAINLAWERNDDAVEIDIQLTQDNKIVVFHDYSTKRICSIDKKIEHQTLSELRQLDAGSFKHENFKGEKIPTLKEVLQSVPKQGKLIIEIKSNEKILPFLKTEITNSKLSINQLEFIGFNLNTISETKKLMPEYKMLWLLDLDYNLPISNNIPDINDLINIVKANNLNGLNCWASDLITETFVKKIHIAGLKLYLWTVDNFKKSHFFAKIGVDAITTNRAQWIKEKMIKIEKVKK